MKAFFIILLLFLLSGCNSTEERKRLLIIETGVNVTSTLKLFLCNDGHKSFLPNTLWSEDKIGHGTTIVKTIAEKLDHQKSCVVIYKTADKGVESDKRAEAYATALLSLTRKPPNNLQVVLLALEDVGYFYKEIDWFNSILAKSNIKIVVAAGNGGLQLRENKECPIYPACLKGHLSNKEQFHVIGSSDGNFNKGSLITAYRKSDGLGTSISAARYASELMD